MSSYSKLGWFAAGALVGAYGLKVLTCKEVQGAAVKVTAAGLRAKSEVMKNVTTVQETAADILAAAEDYNEELAAKAAEEMEEDLIKDAAEENFEEDDFTEVSEDEFVDEEA